MQNKCEFFCATTDSGCKQPSLQTGATRDLPSSWLESPCLNDATCATVPEPAGSSTQIVCSCVDGYEGTSCDTCSGLFEVRCDDKYIVLGSAAGLLVLTMLYIAQTKVILRNFLGKVKGCYLKVKAVAASVAA